MRYIKDILVEKPLALNISEAKELIELSKTHKKVLMVNHILQYHPAVNKLKELILDLLSDNPRPGAPPDFTPEQVTQIIALACSPPRDCGVELSHWTTTALAKEAVKQKIVDSISPASIGRFLKMRRISNRTGYGIG